ncbi:hypothetical protein CTRU02_211527 [Colletotrichum truncatum]|uniref:Uncharacterized protein n=1 Tax=Colletotrichum truncatum TaxID=5467 RepID=A0ACC3YL14_COLTU
MATENFTTKPSAQFMMMKTLGD